MSKIGNFPVITDDGEVKEPLPRYRARNEFLDDLGAEIPDPRPMSSAVAFAADITPEEEVRRLIASADARVLANYARAEESDVDFYDDDFAVPVPNGVDNISSPFEMVHDDVYGGEVPRGIKGIFKRKEKSVEEALEPSAIPPSKKAPKPSDKLPVDDLPPDV